MAKNNNKDEILIVDEVLAVGDAEFQKKCLTILQGFEFDAENKIVGDHVAAIREAFDKKAAGLAMKFVSFQLNIALTEGKDAALRLESSFDEKDCVEQNKSFLFENLP